MNAKNIAADAAIAAMRMVCIKPKATQADMKAASNNKIKPAAGMRGEVEVIQLHLSERTRSQLQYISADCLRNQTALRHTAAQSMNSASETSL